MPGSGKHNVGNIDSFFKVRPSRLNVREGEVISFLEDGNLVKQEKRNGVIYQSVFVEQGKKEKEATTQNQTSSTAISGAISSVSAGTGLSGGGTSGAVTLNVSGVLEDFNTLGAPASDGQFIVATGSGAFAYESGTTVRTSLGLGDLATLNTISNSQVASDASIATSKLAANSITVSDGSTSTAIALGSTATFSGTTNEIEVSESSGTITVGLPNNVTISGNLTVSGSTVTVDADTLTVEDPLIKLAKDNGSSDAVDIGLYGLYDTSGTDKYAGLFRDASDSGKFKLFKDLQAEPTTTVNVSGTGYAKATLVADLEGNVTGNATGNAGTATALATGRDISLTGDVTGTTNTVFDGTGNVSIAASIANNSVDLTTHTTGNYVATLTAGNLIDLQNNTGEGATPTIDVDLSELSTSTSDGDGDFFAVVDSSNAQKKLTKGNINLSGFNNDSGFTSNAGTVTSITVTGGDGLTGGGSAITSSGSVTLAVGSSSLAVSSNAVDIAYSALSTIADDIATTDHIIFFDASNSNAVQIGTVSDLPFTNTSGTVTNVVAGTGLSGGGTTTATLDLDFSELTDMTGDISGSTEFILQNGTTESRKAASEIALSAFNNDITDNNFTNADHSKLDGIEASATADQTASEILTAIKTVDGTSSGLDADLLDGSHGSHYLDAGNLTGSVDIDRLPTKDEDNMASNSVDHVPTQQSVKAFVESQSSGITALNNATENELVTVGSTTTELDAEAGLTYDGDMLTVSGSGGTDGAAGSPTLRINNTVQSTDWDTGDVVGTLEFYAEDTSGNAPYVTSYIKSVAETGNGTLPGGALTFGVSDYNASGGAAEAMRITEDSNVGIGTTSASARLDVVGSGNTGIEVTGGSGYFAGYFGTDFDYVAKFESFDASGAIIIEDSNSTGNANRIQVVGDVMELVASNSKRIELSSGSVVINQDSDDVDFRVESNGNQNMLFVDGGNDRVGIGTNSPSAKLHLAEGFAYIYQTDGVGKLELRDSRASYDAEISQRSDGRISLATRAGTYGSNGSIEILDSGNVGIGTTSPGALFTVRKDGTQASSVSTTYQIQTVSDSNGGMAIQAGGTSSAYLVFGDNANYDAGRIQYNNSNNKMNFQTAETTAMSIDSSQNVGIGTTSPSEKLHVSDSIKADTSLLIGSNSNFLTSQLKVGDGTRDIRLNANHSSNAVVGTVGSHDFNIMTANTFRMTIDSSGDVEVSNKMKVDDIHSLSNDNNRLILDDDTNSSQANGVSLTGANHIYLCADETNNGTGEIRFLKGTDNDLDSGTSVELAKFDNNGNLSFRTDSNSQTRYIHLPRGGGITFYGDTSQHHGIFSRDDSNSVADDLLISSYGAVYIDLDSNNNNTSNANFEIGKHNTANDPLFMVDGEDGKVGIGTSSPDTSLDITSAGANGMVINTDTNDTSNSGRIFFRNSSGSFSMYKVGGYLRVNSGATAGSSSGGTNLISIGSNVGIGTSSPDAKLEVSESGTGAGTGGIISETTTHNGNAGYRFRTNGTDRWAITTIGTNGSDLRIRDVDGSADRIQIDSSGDLHCDQDVVAFSTTPSDKRLKTNIKDINYGLETIMKLNPKQYDWKKDDTHDIGFIAQEVEEVIPEIVKDKKHFDKQIKTLDYEKLTAVLIKAVQEQQQKINKLEEKLNG